MPSRFRALIVVKSRWKKISTPKKFFLAKKKFWRKKIFLTKKKNLKKKFFFQIFFFGQKNFFSSKFFFGQKKFFWCRNFFSATFDHYKCPKPTWHKFFPIFRKVRALLRGLTRKKSDNFPLNLFFCQFGAIISWNRGLAVTQVPTFFFGFGEIPRNHVQKRFEKKIIDFFFFWSLFEKKFGFWRAKNAKKRLDLGLD